MPPAPSEQAAFFYDSPLTPMQPKIARRNPLQANYDLIVIGSGPAGHHAAIQGAKLGKRVAIVDARKCIGGVCIHTGTVPSKTLREAVLYLSGYRERGLYGSSYSVKDHISMEDLLFRTERVIQKESDVYKLQFARNRVEVLEGLASFVDEFTISVDGNTYNADKFVIATGTVPAESADFPVNGESVLNADGVFSLTKIPATM